MKKSIKLNVVLMSLILVIISLNSCKKPVKPEKEKDPYCKCCKTMKLRVLDDMGNAIQMSNNRTVYINNWQNYTKELKTNREYEVTYDEVACEDGCFDNKNGIRPGGCIPYGNRVCINLCTVKEINQSNDNDCNKCSNEMNDYEKLNCGLEKAVVSNDQLTMNCGYSGCDNNEFKNLVLAYNKDVYLKGMGPKDIIPVKVVQPSDLPICQAYFTKNVCFNLKDIKTMIMTNNVKPAPDKVYLSIQYSNQKSELIEWQIK